MRRTLFVTAAGAVAVVPAVIGLTGNPALSHQVPVTVPANVVPVSTKDLAAQVDDNPGSDDRTVAPTSSTRATEPGDDKGGTRTTRTAEPGDDRDQNGGGAAPAPAPRGGDSGHDAGDDHGGSSGGGSVRQRVRRRFPARRPATTTAVMATTTEPTEPVPAGPGVASRGGPAGAGRAPLGWATCHRPTSSPNLTWVDVGAR